MRRWDHKPWHPVWDARIFTLNEIHAIHPVRKAPVTYYALDSPDWVNVIPVTPENEVVLINQYRPGTDSICLEIPGGIVDSGENPHQTATRELTEETG